MVSLEPIFQPSGTLMAERDKELRIFISVAEQSADEHAAKLIEAFRKVNPTAKFFGLAGPAMRAAGCEGFQDLTQRSAMALAAFKKIPEAIRLMSQVKAWLSASRYDAAVFVDSPALHLPMAKICRKLNIPVFYYIAPQTWAWGWRSWRNKRILTRVNRLACIWPFEEEYFRKAGIDAKYVGHPSFDRLMDIDVDEERVATLRNGAQYLITLLPGSRRHVVNEVFPGQLEVAKALSIRFPRAKFLAVAANPEIEQLIKEHLQRGTRRAPVEILRGAEDRAAAISAADLALVASGTITLEVAYHATPMIIMYNTNKWTYRLIGRWLITTPYFAIPNILAQREIVPEFMPYYVNTHAIAARAVEWLIAPGALERVRKDLKETIRPLMKPGAAKNAAMELKAMIESRTGP